MCIYLELNIYIFGQTYLRVISNLKSHMIYLDQRDYSESEAVEEKYTLQIIVLLCFSHFV